MTEKQKSKRNSGDQMMTIGALMIAISIIGGFLGLSMSQSTNDMLLYGGLVIAVLGYLVRTARRRKEKAKG